MHDVYVYVQTYATLLTFHLVMHIQFFIAYMFGKHPEHMWLIYLVEGMYMLPRKFYNMIRAKPMNQGEKVFLCILHTNYFAVKSHLDYIIFIRYKICTNWTFAGA